MLYFFKLESQSDKALYMLEQIHKAFTTRIPLAVMIVMGIKEWENRSHCPFPVKGRCGMSCSKGSDEAEYNNFLHWCRMAFKEEVFAHIPSWERVKDWRGKMIAVMDYESSETPGPPVWNEGYPYWWKLTNVKLLDAPFAVRGNVGMWECDLNVRYED